LRKAHAVHPITAVQTEYSLWTRNPEIAVLKACEELGTTFVAFSPVARGFLCGPVDIQALDAKDIRKSMPRFAADNYAANFKLFAPYQQLAHEAACSPAQLALAWLLHKAPHIIPIPGTTSEKHLLDDLGATTVKLNADLMGRLEDLINERTVIGSRYNAQANSEVDTEVF
jgi:aryl-alcohol dehydrogenase-like predicted oxidoreductase